MGDKVFSPLEKGDQGGCFKQVQGSRTKDSKIRFSKVILKGSSLHMCTEQPGRIPTGPVPGWNVTIKSSYVFISPFKGEHSQVIL